MERLGGGFVVSSHEWPERSGALEQESSFLKQEDGRVYVWDLPDLS